VAQSVPRVGTTFVLTIPRATSVTVGLPVSPARDSSDPISAA